MAMALYQDWVVPVLIDLSMRNKRLRPYRERVAGAAEGRVLDVGIGSGLNLPFFGQRAREVFGLDPSSRLLARAQDQTQHTQVHFTCSKAQPNASRWQTAAWIVWS
jgi:SAM-dependent methyltransferase